MDTNYLEEAFKRLSLLEDDFDISVDSNKIDELKSFIADDREAIPEEEIIDVNAETETDLQDNYIGKVILECECCHSRVYKDKEEVIIDEESGLANIDEQCPVCNNELGYTVIGKIEPFDKEKEIVPEEEAELPADDIEAEVEELPADDIEEVEESLSLEDRVGRKHLTEEKEGVCPNCGKNPCVCEECENESCEVEESCSDELKESFEDPENLGVDEEVAVEDDIKLETPQENPVEEDPSVLDLKEDFTEVEIKTDGQKLEMTSDESGKITVTSEPLVEEEVVEVEDSIVDEPDDAENGPEEIVPLTAEEEVEIENNDEELTDDEELEDIEIEEEPSDEEEEFEIDDFDEESFDEMGESYMRKVYSNVKNYKTSRINESKNSIIIEGLITFESGAQKETRFVFDNASISKRGKLVLEGYNKTFSESKKSFILRGLVEDKKYIPERFIYNYKVKQLNESTGSDETFRVFGRIKRK